MQEFVVYLIDEESLACGKALGVFNNICSVLLL